MGLQNQVQFKHDDASTRREFENVYSQLRSLFKSLLLDVSDVEPADKIAGMRWYSPTADTLKEWTGTSWKQLYPGVFAT